MQDLTSPIQAAINYVKTEMDQIAQDPGARCNEAITKKLTEVEAKLERIKEYEQIYYNAISLQKKLDAMLSSL